MEKLDELVASKQECDFQFIGSNDYFVAKIIDNTNKYIEEHPSSKYINALDSDDVTYKPMTLNLKNTLRDEIALTFCSKKSLTSKVGDELRLLMLE